MSSASVCCTGFALHRHTRRAISICRPTSPSSSRPSNAASTINASPGSNPVEVFEAMTRFLFPIASLLLSVAVLLIGHGLQLTLLPLRGEVLGWSAAEIGLTGSTYYLGFVVGCVTIPRIIARVGHIRTFAALAAAATAVILIIGLSHALLVWLVLRFFTGWALSGLYMVIESWLNERSPTELRGAILSLYAMLTMVATAAGQLFLAEADPAEATLF